MPNREFKGNSLLTFPNNYIVIDIETTGFDPGKDQIIEIGALKVNHNEIIDTFDTLIHVDYIPGYVSDLTGITMHDVKTAPAIQQAISSFYEFIKDYTLVGHNVHFDINFLYDNLLKYTGKYLSNDFVDTLRISKRCIKGLPSYKLSNLCMELDLKYDSFHRALSDCYATHALYQKLSAEENIFTSKQTEVLSAFSPLPEMEGMRFVFKTNLKYYNFSFIQKIAEMNSFKVTDIFYRNSDYLILSDRKYQKYISGNFNSDILYDEILLKAKDLETSNSLKVISELMFYDLFDIPYEISPKKTSKTSSKGSLKDIVTSNTIFDETHPLFDKVCVFTGTLEKMCRRDAMQAVVDLGGTLGSSVTKKTNYLILANNNYSPLIKDGKSSKQKRAEQLKSDGQDIEIISENVFYELLNE